MQTRAVRASAQLDVPGAQSQAVQVPPLQDCIAGQAEVVNPRPSMLQTRRIPSAVQLASPGVQTRIVQ